MILKLTPGNTWVLLSAGFLLLGTLLSLPKIARWNHNADPVAAGAAIAIAAPIIGIFFAANLASNRAQQRYDPVIGFYDYRIPADAVTMLRRIAAERPDRLVMFAVAGQQGAGSPWNNLARKSGIDGDPYYLPRLVDIRLQQANNELHEKVQQAIAGGHVDLALSNALARQGVSLVLPATSIKAVPNWHVVRYYGRWFEISASRK